eukprot:4747802-Pleurochrysis_carterae.AAC.1
MKWVNEKDEMCLCQGTGGAGVHDGGQLGLVGHGGVAAWVGSGAVSRSGLRGSSNLRFLPHL